MTISQLKQDAHKNLGNLYPETEINSFFYWLTEAYLNQTRLELALHTEQQVSSEKLVHFKAAFTRLRAFEPIQHIIGETEFLDLKFEVNPSVLIPRPETESLVRWVLEEHTKPDLNVIDLCTGSGCIAVSLQKNLNNARVSALDVSFNALEVAKRNAETNTSQIDFIKANLLKIKSLPKQYDIIVSNPPYVRNLEKEQMSENVLKHEPHLALFVEDDTPLVFYRKIAELSKKHLKPNGVVYLEINEFLPVQTKALFKDLEFSKVDLRKDLFGKYRMLKAQI